MTDDANGLPMDAQITIGETNKSLRTDAEVGDYHRPLLPGVHMLIASANCHISETVSLTVPVGGQVIQDFALQPTGISGVVLDQGTGSPLAAVIRILGGGGEVLNDSTSGIYEISLCPGAYTMQVEALGYQSIEREVTLENLLVEDFELISLGDLKIYLPTILN